MSLPKNRYLILYLIVLLSQILINPLTGAKEELTRFDSDPSFILEAKTDSWLEPTREIISLTKAKLAEIFTDSLIYRPIIVIAPDLATFNEYIGQKIPDWGAAVAIHERQLIVIKSPANFNLQKSYAELLAHEYAHLMVGQLSRFRTPPRWLNEGVAMYISREWGWNENLAMSKTAVFSQFIPLVGIERMNRFNEGKAQVAYAQSYLAVKFMVDECGHGSPGRFLNAVAMGKSLDEAMYTACGATMKEFEKDYTDYLQNRYNVASLFMDTIFLWIFLALVVVVGFFLKYKKRRDYYKKWAEEERLQSTDFDYGDPDNPETIDDDDESWRS